MAPLWRAWLGDLLECSVGRGGSLVTQSDLLQGGGPERTPGVGTALQGRDSLPHASGVTSWGSLLAPRVPT